MIERTCVIIKPDGVGKKIVGKAISYLEEHNLKLLALKMVRPAKEEIENFYSVHKGKPFFEPFIRFMTSGPIIVSVWEGENCISLVRQIIGNTDSRLAAKGTLRNLYGTDGRKNLVHASDSLENAQQEIDLFFAPEEILKYDENAWRQS